MIKKCEEYHQDFEPVAKRFLPVAKIKFCDKCRGLKLEPKKTSTAITTRYCYPSCPSRIQLKKVKQKLRN